MVLQTKSFAGYWYDIDGTVNEFLASLPAERVKAVNMSATHGGMRDVFVQVVYLESAEIVRNAATEKARRDAEARRKYDEDRRLAERDESNTEDGGLFGKKKRKKW